MAKAKLNRRIKPEVSKLVRLSVLGTQQISPHFWRVTLGEADIDAFEPLGRDQWFRLFLPVDEHGVATPDSQAALAGVPDELNLRTYARFMLTGRAHRPILRNYTVRQFRAATQESGAELDVDVLVHEPAGPASTWARTCEPGQRVALIDEGVVFVPPPPEGATAPKVLTSLRQPVVIVGDESALPAIAGILASLPPDATGRVVIEVPTADDAQSLDTPSCIEVQWLARDESGHTHPGEAADEVVRGLPVDTGAYYWAAGESKLVTGLRRHWVGAGAPKHAVDFVGYWKAARR